VTYSM